MTGNTNENVTLYNCTQCFKIEAFKCMKLGRFDSMHKFELIKGFNWEIHLKSVTGSFRNFKHILYMEYIYIYITL